MYLNWLLEKNPKSNAASVTVQLLKKLKVKVVATNVINELENHPNYPSLLSISDILDKYKIDNLALNVEADKLDSLPTPFIAHIKKNSGSFILVNEVKEFVNFIDENGNKNIKAKDTFIKDWNNIVLVAEATKFSGDKLYNRNKRLELIEQLKLPLVFFLSAVAIFFALIINYTTVISFLLILKFIGIVITALLLWFEVDKSNPFLKQICSTGKNTNCTAILNSKSAKIFNFLSWSEIGFFYFSGGFLYLLFIAVVEPNHISILYLLNLVCVPYIAFSVYYQWRIAKQWCPLCLAVQVLLALEFGISYWFYWSDSTYLNIFTLSIQSIYYSSIAFMLPIIFWLISKKSFLAVKAANNYKRELIKFKFNKDIFNALLLQQKKIDLVPNDLGIIIGNPDAENTIIKVCNPYCGPCAKSHQKLNELLNQIGNLRVQIIFFMPSLKGSDSRRNIVAHLLLLNKSKNIVKMHTALDEWYNSSVKDYDLFAFKYPISKHELLSQDDKIKNMNSWCKTVGIQFTPTFFINGYQLPDSYNIDDLKFLMNY